MRRKYAGEPIGEIKKKIEEKRKPVMLGPFKEEARDDYDFDSGGEVAGLGSEPIAVTAPKGILLPPPNLLAQQLQEQFGGEAIALTHTAIARAKQQEDRVKELAATVSAISKQVKVLRRLQTRVDAAPTKQKLALRVDLNIEFDEYSRLQSKYKDQLKAQETAEVQDCQLKMPAEPSFTWLADVLES